MKLVKSNFQFLAPEGANLALYCTYPFGPKWQILCLKPILSAIFVTIATVKFK